MTSFTDGDNKRSTDDGHKRFTLVVFQISYRTLNVVAKTPCDVPNPMMNVYTGNMTRLVRTH